MEKRKDVRVKKRIMAKINNHPGILVDISRKGFKFSTTNIPTSRDVTVSLQIEGKTFILKGYTRWVCRKLAGQKLYEIGISLKEADRDYLSYLEKILPLQAAHIF